MASWKRQMCKMLDHMETLESPRMCVDRSVQDRYSALGGDADERLLRCGERIKERLKDLIIEYDEHIAECTTTIEAGPLDPTSKKKFP